MIHINYAEMNEKDRETVDAMYKLINAYAKENGIKLAYDDTAEIFVEAIATYLINSR